MVIRLQIELDESKMQEMESIMQECGIRTKKEFFNIAFTLFEWAVNKRKSGSEIVAVNPEAGKYVELNMPALSNVRKSQ